MSKRLTLERQTRGWTRVALGAKARINPNRIGQFENGRAVPPTGSIELLRIAQALGIPASEADTLLEEIEGDGPAA